MTSDKLTPELLTNLHSALLTGIVEQTEISLRDDVQANLGVVVTSSEVAYYAHYKVQNYHMRLLRIGDFPALSIDQARKYAAMVQGLADKGVYVEAALMQRLRESLRDGP